jgi:uncharacterized membrane protein YcaP (DUF421 family)
MELVLRTVVVYWILWAVIRGTGKRELAQIGPFDLVLLIVVGDVVQQAVTQEDMSVTGALIVLATMGLMVLLVGAVTRRSERARGIIEGVPTVVVRDGEVLDENVGVERLPLADLREAARNRGIDDLDKVRYAIVEPNGRFSFLTVDEAPADDSDEGPDVTR